MAGQPTVLFCVGAAKAGTSWLFRYLQEHPDCHVRSIKELHYFDARAGDSAWRADSFRRQRQLVRDRLARAEEAERAELKRQIADFDHLIALLTKADDDLPGYLRFLNKGRDGQSVVADVTPAYSLLPVGRLRQMVAAAATTRFIYILRDPVTRLWSHIRMNAARRARTEADVQARANRIFWRYGRGRHPGIRARGDYRAALDKLTAAVRPGQLLVVFYEELFTGAAVDLICDFLGIRRHPAQIAVPVHTGPMAEMTDEQVRHAAGWLADQYAYVQAKIDHLPEVWQANRMGVCP